MEAETKGWDSEEDVGEDLCDLLQQVVCSSAGVRLGDWIRRGGECEDHLLLSISEFLNLFYTSIG